MPTSPKTDTAVPALLLIDWQRAIDHPSWGVRNNPHAEERAQRLLAYWRERKWPLVHIRHDSREPDSTYRPGQPLHEFKPGFAPLPGERVIGKATGSAFAGTGLADLLHALGVRRVVICGVITNNSVESTVRAGRDLGFSVELVEDACFTFEKRNWSAQEMHDMSLANLSGEYAVITTVDRVTGPSGVSLG